MPTSQSTEPFRVSAIQMCSVADRARNLAGAAELIARAADDRPDILALPENFSFLGEGEEKVAAAEDMDGPSMRFLKEQAAKYGITIVGGTIPLSHSSDRVTNTCFVVDPDGRVLARYDKIHLFDVAIDERHMHRESDAVAPGGAVVTFDWRGVTIGLTICYDVRFPELYRRLARSGAAIVFVPSAFTVPTGQAHWEVLLRARAIENQCYIVAPAQNGRHSGRRSSYGHSMIVDPWGRISAQMSDGDGVITASIDLHFMADVRERLPALTHVRTDIF